MKSFLKVLAVTMAFVTVGCLKTRTEVKETEQRHALSTQVTTLQRDTADVNSRFQDVNEEMRVLRGRVEEAEHKLSMRSLETDKSRQATAEQNAETQRRVGLLQETVTRLDTQMQALNAEVQALRAEIGAARAGKAAVAAAASAKNPYEAGIAHFDKKEWKKAILALQEYRDKFPKGKKAPEATYLIGVSFQELGLKDEAKTFYDEVVARYPKSSQARKAKTRLKNFKSSKR